MTHDVAENMRLLKMIREVARLEAENADLLRRLDRWEAGLRAAFELRVLEQPDA